MHRHGYKGRKFGRETDQRRALMRGLADSLIKYGSIETTLPKAKEIVPYVEKLITKAKKGDLHNRRLVIAKLHTIESAHKLFDEIAPKLTKRSSGHLRIERTTVRRGDNTQLAQVSFVDTITDEGTKPSVKESAPAKKSVEAKPAKKKPATASASPKKEKVTA
jgi:large subunit ribosomal protein L17